MSLPQLEGSTFELLYNDDIKKFAIQINTHENLYQAVDMTPNEVLECVMNDIPRIKEALDLDLLEMREFMANTLAYYVNMLNRYQQEFGFKWKMVVPNPTKQYPERLKWVKHHGAPTMKREEKPKPKFKLNLTGKDKTGEKIIRGLFT